jgi:antitoxin VapB
MEFQAKQEAVRHLLQLKGLDALLLRRVSSFAWATCGGSSYVNSAVAEGIASLLVTPSGLHLITDSIEAPRLEREQKLKEQGWEFHIHLWHEQQELVSRLVGGLRLGADVPYPGAVDLSGEVARLRGRLTTEEGKRFRDLGKRCAEAMNAAIRAVQPGQTEYEIAAHLDFETERRGVQPIVNLIATDERIFAYRHPLPTGKVLDRYAMLVLCGRKHGLVCSVTRLVHFGRLPDELRRKAQATGQVDAVFIANTRPGQTLGNIFQTAVEAYRSTGYPEEWHLHHQGGLAAYEPREVVAVPGLQDGVYTGQVYAWNPSITGTKSEDTILVGAQENEVLTHIAGWPTLTVPVPGQEMERPAILEIT